MVSVLESKPNTEIVMSLKDTRFYRDCPICDDRLVGTDDGLEVYETLRDQLMDPTITKPACTLCGEECTREEAQNIVDLGEPTLHESDSDEDEDDDY